MQLHSADRLLLVFVHGFRGSDTSFKDFPSRLKAIAPYSNVHTIVYPRYKTAGDFNLATENLLTWLKEQIKKQQEDMGARGETGDVLIVLLGHSMGGLVSAEVILRVYTSPDDNVLQGGHILGLVGFDSPFYSVNHRFVSSTALSHVETVNRHVSNFWSSATTRQTSTMASNRLSLTWPEKQKPSLSSFSQWGGLLAGAVGVAAVGAAAYLAKDHIAASVTNVFDHLEFVSTLLDFNGCYERVEALSQIKDLVFKCFYILLPTGDEFSSDQRTFIARPPLETAHYFVPVMSRTENEIEAHMNMFDPVKNEDYYVMGQDTMTLVSEMISRHNRRSSQR